MATPDLTSAPRPLREQLAGLLAEARMYLAEMLLGWIIALLPKGHPDAPLLLAAIRGYIDGRAAVARERLKR